ncbi:hypothetical protein [Ferruginibacter sp.]
MNIEWRKIFRGFAVTLIFCYVQSATAQHITIKKTPAAMAQQKTHQPENELGAAVFKAFSRQDSAVWINLYPSQEEYKNILQQMLAGGVEGLTQPLIDTMLLQRAKEAGTRYSDEFREFRRQSDSLGIDWQKVVFEKFDFLAAFPEKVQLKYLTGDIKFSCGGQHFIIADVEALQLPVGYKLQSVKCIRKRSEWE